MSETLDVIKNRRSYRNYKPDSIPDEILDKIIEAGTWAPSGKNLQSSIIVEITNKTVIKKLSALNAKVWGKDEDPFFGAPVVLAVLALKDVPTHVYDGSLVIANLMLAAEDQGLGSCWVHRAKEVFEMYEAKIYLNAAGINSDLYEGIGFVVLGVPSGEIPEPPARKKDYIYYID